MDPILTAISAENFSGAQTHRAGGFATAGRDGSLFLLSLPSTESDRAEPWTFEGNTIVCSIHLVCFLKNIFVSLFCADYQGLKSHVVHRAHEDAIWDLHAHPLSNILFSAGADGIVRTWGISSGKIAVWTDHELCLC